MTALSTRRVSMHAPTPPHAVAERAPARASARRLVVVPAAPAPSPEPLVENAPGFWARLRDRVDLWRRRAAGRRALAEMTPRMLADIGVSPFEAAHEATKPFWRA